MSWQCNYCGRRLEPVREDKADGVDWPAGRGCSECSKGEIVYRPVEPSPTVAFVVQENEGGDWKDTVIAFKEDDALRTASDLRERHQHNDRYHFDKRFRVVRRAEKVIWEKK